MKKHTFYSFLLIALAAFFLFFYFKLVTPGFLTFSDGAKFADVARNIFKEGVYGSTFIFFSPPPLDLSFEGFFNAKGILPAMPLSIVGSFLLFGVSDFAVIFTSGVFYLVLVLFVFLLGKKLYGNLIGFLSAFAVASNVNMLDYATTGASEILIFLLIVLLLFLFTFKKRWTDLAGFIVLIAMYFSRTQGFIYIASGVLFWFFMNFPNKKAFNYFILTVILGILIDRKILGLLSKSQFIYGIFGTGKFAITRHSSSLGTSGALRGSGIFSSSYIDVIKKVFYNLYNFYKLLPQIASPYIWTLFVIGLFKWGKDRVENSLKLATVFMIVVTFLVTALTIPFFRYLHPVTPLVYLFATATLVWTVEKTVNYSWLVVKKYIPKRIRKKSVVIGIISTLLTFFFVVGQTLGVIFLDSRFKAARTNRGKPPVYAELSWLLRDNTEPSDVIVTNLDTWGSWYGERRTVWFPLRPEQLEQQGGKKISFDAIYLTSYLIDDENYYMGDEWRQVFYNPEKPEDRFIAENFELKGVYQVSAEENYEKQDARAVLLVRKED